MKDKIKEGLFDRIRKGIKQSIQKDLNKKIDAILDSDPDPEVLKQVAKNTAELEKLYDKMV